LFIDLIDHMDAQSAAAHPSKFTSFFEVRRFGIG